MSEDKKNDRSVAHDDDFGSALLVGAVFVLAGIGLQSLFGGSRRRVSAQESLESEIIEKLVERELGS